MIIDSDIAIELEPFHGPSHRVRLALISTHIVVWPRDDDNLKMMTKAMAMTAALD